MKIYCDKAISEIISSTFSDKTILREQEAISVLTHELILRNTFRLFIYCVVLHYLIFEKAHEAYVKLKYLIYFFKRKIAKQVFLKTLFSVIKQVIY